MMGGITQVEQKSKLPLILGVIGIILLGFFLLWLFFSKPLSITSTLSLVGAQEYTPGDLVVFEKNIVVSKKKVTTEIVSQIISPDGKVVVERKETLIITKSSKSQTRLQLPVQSGGGQYSIKVSARAEKSVSEKSVSFTVKAKKESSEPTVIEKTCPEECVSKSTCMRAVCKEGVCDEDPIVPCCGNARCEVGEDSQNCAADCLTEVESPEVIYASAKEEARRNVEQAIVLCTSMIEDVKIDACLKGVMKDQKNRVVCASMKLADARDACYMDLALSGDFSGCDKIQDRYRAHSCVYLEQAQTVRGA